MFVAKQTEKSVLGGSLMWEKHAQWFMDAGIRESHFYSRHHAIVWRRIVQAVREGADPPGFTHVLALLTKHKEIEDVGIAYLASLSDGVPRFTAGLFEATARHLTECLVGRRTLEMLSKAHTQLRGEPAALTEGFFSAFTQSLEGLARQLAGRRLPGHISHISEVMEDVVASLKTEAPEFVDTPWPALTSMLGGGLAPGEMAYLGARPGVGKTAAALEIARKAGRQGRSSLIVSREMRKRAIGLRMLSQETPLDATKLRKRDLSDYQWNQIGVAVERLSDLPIYLTHDNVDVDEIRRLVGTLVDEGTLGLLIVDYLQLIDAPAGIQERRLQVEAVSKRLKAITLDFNVPVLCLSSLSRPPEGKAPTLASLRESGNLEHDADTVIFLHRPQELEPKTQCIVAKARNGRTGMVELFFRGEFLRFEEPYAEVS